MKNWMLILAATVALSFVGTDVSAQNNGAREPTTTVQRPGKTDWNPAVPNGTAVLQEGFTDILTLPGAGWVQTNNSNPVGTTGWFQGNDAVFPAQAGATTSYIGANFNNTSGTDIDNWLITPVLPLSTLSEFSFFSRSPDGSTFPDRIQVRMNVTNTGSATSDFTVLLADVNPVSTAGWAQTVINSFPGAPTSGRLAFRYFVSNGGPTGANSDFIGIDSVVAIQGVAALSLGTVGAVDSCAALPSNNNGIIEPGEMVQLSLPVSAAGGDFTNVTGMLTSSTAGVTIVSGMGSYGNITAGNTANASYTVMLDSTVTCGSTFNLSLAVTSGQGNFTFPISRGVGQAGVINYNGLPAAIPDNMPAVGGSSTADVAGVPSPLTNVQVRVGVTHTWVGDLRITLTSPGGTTVTLLDQPGAPTLSAFGCNNNDIAVTFADGQPDPENICDGAGQGTTTSPWPVSNAGPVTPLSALNGQNGNGQWTLTVFDNAGGDTGSITDWELILTPAPAGTCEICPSNPSFNFNTASVNFGAVPVGSTSGITFVTLSNSGDGPGTIDSLTFAGPFSRSGGTCPAAPFILAAGQSCTVGVVFNAAAGNIGNFTGSLTAVGAGQTVVVALSGQSVIPPPAFIPVNNPWALALLLALMGVLGAGGLLLRRNG